MYLYSSDDKPLGWIQSEEFVMDTIKGILLNSKEFRDGEDVVFEYDFENEEYSGLLEKYRLEDISGEGSEFIRARNLMNEYAARIRHSSSVAVSPENMNAEYLLENYLDNKKQGTYCRAKAQILNEMCLALGIYSRKLWIVPLSRYDDECHVVNEVWDSEYGKWIMLDISNNLYWVDENAVPLSMLEVRDKIISEEFCTPVLSSDDLSDLKKSFKNNKYYFTYYAKNLAALRYMDTYTVGETNRLFLIPVNYTPDENWSLISRESVERSPLL